MRTSSPRTLPDIPRVPWDDLGPEFMRAWGWPGGQYDPEHFTVYGPSGSGKTYLVREVLRMRAETRGSHIVVVATKKTDATISSLGWPIITSWPPDYGQHQNVYWAKAKGISAEHRLPQRAKVKALMNELWVPQSNIIIYWDELGYLQDMLKLGPELETYYREGRALGITNVASMQRPARVTRLAHSEAGWTAAFCPRDADDRRRVAEVLGDRATYSHVLSTLNRRKHEFLLRHDRSGESYITSLPPPSRQRRR